ncbi:beta-N-acetylhexosaminidase [Paenibacillus polysaccharolyticus]|uniref:beta-N-acetylhexosaminidase n=1 Tax=Paenibacillus polysaccharolyticus TaxID=582692 RepID=UPI0020402B58|nr:beta-N-acetylhexosaminidase [Paenibacillus polysaccharolyticus]MCM3132324.1 beta-N-acetylhexosaminidase [Paenibacillus polysaccharolyticus]
MNTILRFNRHLRFVLVLPVIAALILLLAACGQTPKPSTATDNNNGTAASPNHSPSGNNVTQPQDEAHEEPQNDSPLEENDPVKEQIQQLTLEEKVGQMILAGVQGTALDEQAKRMIADQKIGGIIFYANNVTTLQGTAAFVQSIKEANQQNPVPILMSVDQEGGKVSRMPEAVESIPPNRKVGKTNDTKLAEKMGALLARQVKLAGFNVDFAPVLDINSNPKNPVIGDRSFGTTAALVTRMGMAEMKGLRSEEVIPVVKHFPGHGDTSVDSHLDLPVVNKSEKQLAELEWIPFQAAVKQQAEAVMVAHILFPKLDPNYPASLSKVIIGDHLRGKFKYDGVVITDDLSMGAISKNYPLNKAAIATVQAGSDILLVAHSYESARTIFDTLISAVKSGKIKESRIDESVYRILELKQHFKLSDDQKATGDVKQLNADIRSWRKQVDAR